jgi:hypothetical protein
MTRPSDRPLYIITVKPEAGVDGVQALRSLLKVMLRRFGLRAVTITPRPPAPPCRPETVQTDTAVNSTVNAKGSKP